MRIGDELGGGRGANRRGRRLVTNLSNLNPVERIGHFFAETIWEDVPPGSRLKGLLYPKLRVLTLAFWNLQTHDAPTYAASLTYTSLLAIVPFLAVAFSLFLVFGGLEKAQSQVQDFILDYIAPGLKANVKDNLALWLKNIRARGGSTAILGAIVLVVTTVRTLTTLESTFNRIVGVKKGRPWAARITVYWALATLGPLLLGASLAMTATIRSSSFVQWLETHAPFIIVLYRFAPVLLTSGAFTLLYMFLPHAKVKPRAALIGGFVAGIAFEIAKSGFTVGAVKLVQTQNEVYGSIATLFVFLFWLYISWMIILVGLEVVVAVQSATTHRKEELATQVSQKFKEILALRIVTEVSERFHRGENVPPTVEELAKELDVPERLLYDLLGQLEDMGIIRWVEVEGEQHGFIPARTLEKITVRDVIIAMREHGAEGLSIRADEDTGYLLEILERTEEACTQVWAAENFKHIVESLDRRKSASAEERRAQTPAAQAMDQLAHHPDRITDETGTPATAAPEAATAPRARA